MAKSSGGVRNTRPKGSSSQQARIEEAQRKIRASLELMHQNLRLPQIPFEVGPVEKEMLNFSRENNVDLGDVVLSMSPKQIQHAQRDVKRQDGKAVSRQDLIDFPKNYHKMELYYDTNKKNFIYRDGNKKYVFDPAYKIKKIGKRILLNTASEVDESTQYKPLAL